MMNMTRERLQDYQGNGVPVTPTFSAKEMKRRQDNIRKHMTEHKIDAALFTTSATFRISCSVTSADATVLS
jgi:Xaa-Pro aminopeptidase